MDDTFVIVIDRKVENTTRRRARAVARAQQAPKTFDPAT
jgi:hypothetical protein